MNVRLVVLLGFGGLKRLITIFFDIRLTNLQFGQLIARQGARIRIPTSVVCCKLSEGLSAVE